MVRQTRREKKRENSMQECKEEKIHINRDDAVELMHFVYTLRFYINHHMKIDSKHALEILHYAIGSKADEVWFSKFMKEIQIKGMKACQMFIDELIEQAFKKGFSNVKTYVQFLKLTCIKRNVLMQIL